MDQWKNYEISMVCNKCFKNLLNHMSEKVFTTSKCISRSQVWLACLLFCFFLFGVLQRSLLGLMLLGNFTSDLSGEKNTLFIQSWNPDAISDNHWSPVPASSFPVIGVKSAHATVMVAHLATHSILWSKWWWSKCRVSRNLFLDLMDPLSEECLMLAS